MDNTRSKELDLELLKLALLAQQQPVKTIKRQLVLTRLVNEIKLSGRLCHPQRNQFSARLYEEIYNEALQELWLYICQNIHKYEPERASVIVWVNVLLERRFFREAIPKVLGKASVERMNLSELENTPYLEEPPALTEVLREYIENDPENLFKKEHIEKYPSATFQALAQRRFKGKSWKEIAAEFEVKIPTASSFYYRCIDKFQSKIREHCVNC
ncbi:hypothetical protein RIVM261_017670 [Rivularia sp. IAM M-261]|nr:hypothetical protein CAL7716_029850 [Calothrix sp. PCC 7716]GJD16811.1 hypothetical protein RIVM261_017670 [Rivularia sp. IAM M-261]